MIADVIKAIGNSKDALQAIFAVVGIVVAILGLRTWKQQLAGKAEYELATRLLRTIYTVRDRVRSLRSPFISAGEMYAAGKEKVDDEKELNRLLNQNDKLAEFAYQVRWERVQEAVSDLVVEELEAEVLWENKVKSKFKPFYDCLSDLQFSLEDYLSMRRGDYDPVSDEDMLERKRVVLRGWGTRADQKDEFGNRFSTAIQELTQEIRPYLDIK